MNKTISPPIKLPRVSVPVSEEVRETFERLAKAQGMSTGRAMAEWLSDTLEAAQFMALKIEQARAAPALVMREMHAYAQGLADETGTMIARMKAKGEMDRARDSGAAASDTASRGRAGNQIPPSCNTGGKLPRENPRTQGGKSK